MVLSKQSVQSSSFRRKVTLLALATAGVSGGIMGSTVYGQSTWTQNASSPWETATNWNGGVPNSATAIAIIPDNSLPGNTQSIFIATNITLAQLTMNSSINYVIAQSATTTGSIVIPASGMTLSVLKARSASPSFVPAPSNISVPLTGGPLTKNGPALITLGSTANTFSSLSVTEGLIRIATGNDNTLGAAGGTLNFSNGGGIRVITTALTTGRTINIGAGGGTFDNSGSTFTSTGPIIGTTSVFRTGTGTTNLNGDMSGFSGFLSARTTGTTSIGGAAVNLSSIDFSGTLTLNNTTSSNSNRLSDTAPILSRGGDFRLSVSFTGANIAEVIGPLTLESGQSVISASVVGATQGSLAVASITRNNRATVVVRGTSLGSAAATGVGTVTLGAAPAGLTGAATGTTTVPIIPWIIASGGIANTTTGIGLATYDSLSGAVRPLATAEYATTFTGAGNENVRLTGTADVPSDVSAAALVISNTSVTGTGAITVTTGAVVTTDGAVTIANPLNFGAAEGILHFTTATTTSNTLSGSAGITKAGVGTWTITGAGASSTYTGQTTLNAGSTVVSGNLPADGTTPSAFGLSTTPIVLSSGSNFLQLTSQGGTVIDRGLVVTGGGSSDVYLGSTNAGTGSITVNGAVNLQKELVISGTPVDPANLNPSTVTINGVISGPGRLADNGDNVTILINGIGTAIGARFILNGQNTFTGGLRLNSYTTWIAGNDNAFGTGTIWFTGGNVGTLSATGTKVIPNAISVINNSGSVAFSGDSTVNLTLSGPIDLGGPTADLFVNTANPLIFSGKLSNGRFTKNGTGTLVITGNSSDYTGNPTINAGILQIGNNGPDGNLPGFISVGSAAQVIFRRTGTVILPGTITGAGERFVEAGGTVVLSGNTTLTNTGKWNINNGTLQSGNNNAGGTLGSGEIAIASTGAFVYRRTSNLSLANTFTGAGSITQAGPGTATLTGTLTGFTGNVNVTDSILQANNPLRPAGTSALNVTGTGTAIFAGPVGGVVAEFGSITVGATGTARVAAVARPSEAPRALVANTLSITGTLDLTNNNAVFRGETVASVSALVKSWWADGARNGLGLASSTAFAGVGDNALATLAVVSNDNGLGGAISTTFSGATVTATDVLVKYTFLGDTDIDGDVDTTDLTNLIKGIRSGGTLGGWAYGDSNYDGKVDGLDYANLLTSLRFASGTFADIEGSGTGVGGGVIPEPTSLGLMLAASPLLSRRRRR